MQHTINDLKSALWGAADEMRKIMSADKYKDYLLGLIFYKALSDKVICEAYSLVNDDYVDGHIDLNEAQNCYEQAIADQNICGELTERLLGKLGCAIKPELTFGAIYKKVNTKEFKLEHLKEAFKDIEASAGNTYAGLFDDFDVNSNDLGKESSDRNALLSGVISSIANIDFSLYPDDALGDSYEYLIAQFASESGKKAGEFYTPQAVSQLMARFVTFGKETTPRFSVYDPCCGSGSLLLQIKNFINNIDDPSCKQNIEYYGQELNNQTYNLARMNMMLHKVLGRHQHLNQADTLAEDWPNEGNTKFDACVMNPPYSLKYSADQSLLDDPRFSKYGVLPPQTKADYAFLLHGLYHLKDDGTMAIVLPHGVLFRGASEGKIRKALLDEGNIYAVIGLPAGIFYNTGIPTCIIVLKKNHTSKDVLFIDASQDFHKDRAKNFLLPEHIDKIFKAYQERTNVDKYAYLASYEEIVKNDYNLNIPRYVDNIEAEEQIDLNAAFAALAQAQTDEQALDQKLASFYQELGLNPQGGL